MNELFLLQVCSRRIRNCKALTEQLAQAQTTAKDYQVRAETLGRKYHDTVVQLGQLQKVNFYQSFCDCKNEQNEICSSWNL